MKNRFNNHLFLIAFFLASGITGSAPPVFSQEIRGIVAVVNDSVISSYDLESRIKLVLASANIEDKPEAREKIRQQVLQSLIQERVQIQESKKRSIEVSALDIEDAIRRIEKSNNMPEGGFPDFLAEQGVDVATLKAQIEANLAWDRLVARRLLPQIDIGDEEIDEEIARMEDLRGKPEYLLAEIFLSVNAGDDENEIRHSAEEIIQHLREGRPFPALAQQFSQSVSAANGGDIGWNSPGQLDPALDEAISGLEPGRAAGPIRSLTGYHIILLRDKRIIGGDSAPTINLMQIFLPLPPGYVPEEITLMKENLEKMTQGVAGCEDMKEIKDASGAGMAHDLGTLSLTDLPENIQTSVAPLEIGAMSEVVEGNGGLMTLMVCARSEPESSAPNRDQIYRALELQRLDLLAQRHIRDLRHAAHVDIRLAK